MESELHKLLRPVRRRLTWQRAIPRVAFALLTGGWLALVAALLTLFGGSMTSGMIGIAVAVCLPLVALGWALVHPASWQDAARLVDRRLRLHDRTSTALQLASETSGDPFAQMQVADAVDHLKSANLSSMRPVSSWQRVAGGLLLTCFSLALILWGILAPPTQAIQTSGDMQDVRPEILPRTRVEVGPLSSEAIAGGENFWTADRDRMSIEKTDVSISADVIGNYFDRLNSHSD